MSKKDCLRFFAVVEAPVVMESIYCESYKDFQCCSVRNRNEICIFFKKIDLVKTNKEGIELFSSSDKFDEYYNSFIFLLASIPAKCNSAIQRSDALAIINIVLEFLSYYRWTEFFYTDEAFSIVNQGYDNENLKTNLALLSKLKYNARKVLNSFFMEKDSYFNLLSKKVSGKTDILDMRITDIRGTTLPSVLASKNHILTSEQVLLSDDTDEFLTMSALFLKKKDGKMISGTAASKGTCNGRAFVISSDFSNYEEISKIIDEMPPNSVLVSETTSPELVLACHKAMGIITNQGGLGSHAAIISRELKIPCVVGTGDATLRIKTGDEVFVDGSSGNVVVK